MHVHILICALVLILDTMWIFFTVFCEIVLIGTVCVERRAQLNVKHYNTPFF